MLGCGDLMVEQDGNPAGFARECRRRSAKKTHYSPPAQHALECPADTRHVSHPILVSNRHDLAGESPARLWCFLRGKVSRDVACNRSRFSMTQTGRGMALPRHDDEQARECETA